MLERRLAGRPATGLALVHFAETRQELASFLSMQPETLSRALKALAAREVIRVSGRSILVLSQARLVAERDSTG